MTAPYLGTVAGLQHELALATERAVLAEQQRDEAHERLADLRHDVLRAWRAAGPRPKPPKRCPAKSFTLGRCDQPGGHEGMHSTRGEGFGVRVS